MKRNHICFIAFFNFPQHFFFPVKDCKIPWRLNSIIAMANKNRKKGNSLSRLHDFIFSHSLCVCKWFVQLFSTWRNSIWWKYVEIWFAMISHKYFHYSSSVNSKVFRILINDEEEIVSKIKGETAGKGWKHVEIRSTTSWSN